MTNAITGAGDAPALASEHVERIGEALVYSLAPATRRAYASTWRRFEPWTVGADIETLPTAAATVAAYLASLADAGPTERRPCTRRHPGGAP